MKQTNRIPAALALLAATFLAACADSTTSSPASPDAATLSSPAPGWTATASFSPAAFELPEGLAVHDGSAYVGLAPLGQILKIGPDGAKTLYATVPAGYNDGYTTGLTFDREGNLFVLATKNNPNGTAPITPGVYKIPPTIQGGAVTVPFATHPEMLFPNAAELDSKGTMYVTDSATGSLFAITPAGLVSKWATGTALSGSPACPAPLPFEMGANGLVVTPTAIFVTNTAKGSIVKVAINPDGSSGEQTVLVQGCQYVGLDGLTRESEGSLLVAQNGNPGRILRFLEASSELVAVEIGAPLDGPASVVVSEAWNGSRVALVTNSAFFSAGAEGGAPRPSLLSFAPRP